MSLQLSSSGAEMHWTAKWLQQKVLAFVCGWLSLLLLSLSASTAWLVAPGWSEGLFALCVDADAARRPMPFGELLVTGCYKSRRMAYVRIPAALCVVALLADVVVILLTLIRLVARDFRFGKKCRYLAVGFALVSLSCVVAALILSPLGFTFTLEDHRRETALAVQTALAEQSTLARPVPLSVLIAAQDEVIWLLGPGYALGWAAALAILAGSALQFCDSADEEQGGKTGGEIAAGGKQRTVQIAVVDVVNAL